MSAPGQLSPGELASITDPGALLERAWALEPAMRITERRETLGQLARLLDSPAAPPSPPGRSWRLELLAERAVDAAANVLLAEATALADRVLAEADPTHEIAIARALLARGRALAWTGTDAATRRADRVLVEVADRFRALGSTDWLGFVLFWRGNAICFQNGELPRAAELMREALDVLGPDSPRRSTVLTFYADVLTSVGEWDAAEATLAEAADAAERDEDAKSRAYVAWSRARIASVRGDALLTQRLIREVERDTGDWFAMHTGATFLADAGEMLDRVGLCEQAESSLRRATARAPDDEFVRQAHATLLARSGDPLQALESLQRLAEGDWLEKRLLWRHTLLTAWATFRAGRDDAGTLVARALQQAHACGGLRVAQAGEPELVGALAPLAEGAGSAHAREILLGGRPLLVRLFGPPVVIRADGSPVPLPPGMPGELVRMLALHERGLPVEVVLDAFFGEAPPAAARQRLRQVLTRLRAAAGEVVVRDGEQLRLLDAWVDVREFLAAANRVRGTRGPPAVRRAYAALALRRGPLLPVDRYAAWAEAVRDQVEYRHLGLLDLVAGVAAARGSHEEALAALDAAFEEDPRDGSRYGALVSQLSALGRERAADHLARRAGLAPADAPAAAAPVD